MEKKQKQIFTIPNLLSFFRIGLIPVIVWLYWSRQHILAGFVLILSGLTDMVDGFVARKYHMISDLGKMLDPIADKLTQAAILLCLLMRFPLMAVPFGLLAVKELFMGITGLMVIRIVGAVPGAAWHGKLATAILYATMILHIFWPQLPHQMSVSTIAACTVMIGVSFLLYGRERVKAIAHSQESPQEGKGAA